MIFQEKFGSVRKGPGTFLGMFLLVKETKGVEQKSSENGALGRGQGWNTKLRRFQVMPFLEDCSKNKQKICKSL